MKKRKVIIPEIESLEINLVGLHHLTESDQRKVVQLFTKLICSVHEQFCKEIKTKIADVDLLVRFLPMDDEELIEPGIS